MSLRIALALLALSGCNPVKTQESYRRYDTHEDACSSVLPKRDLLPLWHVRYKDPLVSDLFDLTKAELGCVEPWLRVGESPFDVYPPMINAHYDSWGRTLDARPEGKRDYLGEPSLFIESIDRPAATIWIRADTAWAWHYARNELW